MKKLSIYVAHVLKNFPLYGLHPLYVLALGTMSRFSAQLLNCTVTIVTLYMFSRYNTPCHKQTLLQYCPCYLLFNQFLFVVCPNDKALALNSKFWGFNSPLALSPAPGRDIFYLNIYDTFSRTSVRESKLNAVVCAQLTFQMLTTHKKYLYRHDRASVPKYGIKMSGPGRWNGRAFDIAPWVRHWLFQNIV